MSEHAAGSDGTPMSRRVRVERVAALGRLGLQIVNTLPTDGAVGLPDPVIEAVEKVLDAAERLVEIADCEARYLDEARDLG